MKAKYATFLPITLLFLLVGCGNNDSAFRNQFRWLSGKWTGKDGETTVIENWKWNKYRFEGRAYRIYNGDTTTEEKLFLQSFDGHPSYLVVVNGKGPYSFPFEGQTENAYRFVNEDHDFPSIIQYTKASDSILTIQLNGLSPEAPTVQYELTRGR